MNRLANLEQWMELALDSFFDAAHPLPWTKVCQAAEAGTTRSTPGLDCDSRAWRRANVGCKFCATDARPKTGLKADELEPYRQLFQTPKVF
jgi:hypothetical protein